MLFNRLILIGIVALPMDTTDSIQISLVALIFMLIVHLNVQPYTVKHNNLFDTLVYVTLILIAILLQLENAAESIDNNEDIEQLISFGIAFLAFLPLIVIFVSVVYSIYRDKLYFAIAEQRAQQQKLLLEGMDSYDINFFFFAFFCFFFLFFAFFLFFSVCVFFMKHGF